MFEERSIRGKSNCESGCAYNGITDVLTNLLMKVQRDTVSENRDHNSYVSLTIVWTLEFPTLSTKVTESAAWFEVAFPDFYLVYCEHWKCVNRSLLCCRGVVARLSSCNGDVRR